jgi:adenine-specific DNA-methyltransferase
MPTESPSGAVTPEVEPAELAALRNRVAELEGGLSLGLNWREIPEDFEIKLASEVPVFSHQPQLDIEGALPEDYAHVLIEGDNLHALYTLQATHKAKVDVVYIDPPYNTGEEFIYNDKLIDKENTWRHSAWLSFMQKRLKLAFELLKDTGVIIISIDDNEQARLKILCDKIFGEAGYLGSIIRATNSTKSMSNYLSINYDYTLFYAKNKPSLDNQVKSLGKWEVNKNNIREFQAYIKKFQKKNLSSDEITAELKELTNYPRFVDFVNYWYVDERGVYRKGDLGGVKNGSNKPIFNPLTKTLDKVPPGGYRYSQEKLQELISENRIHFHTDGSLPTIKRYLNENPKQRPKGIMSDDQRPDFNMLKLMGIEFDNPKQLTFMKRILSIFPKDALILDFFAGSATTLHAIIELNAEDEGARQGILVTNNENDICRSVSHVRIRSLLSGKWSKGEYPPLKGSLKFYSTAFMERHKSPDRMREALSRHTVELVSVREKAATLLKVNDHLFVLHGPNSTIAVVPFFDAEHVNLQKLAETKVRPGDHKGAYLFTWSSQGVESEIAELWDGWRVEPIPAQMLSELRRLAPTPTLFDGEVIV